VKILNIELICSEKNYKKLKKILQEKNFIISKSSEIAIIEDGYHYKSRKVQLIFNQTNLDKLIEFINKLSYVSISNNNLILGKKDNSYKLIKHGLISYFEANGNDVSFISENNRFYVKSRLYEIEETLSSKGFIRINKSYIINIRFIKDIIPWFNSRILLKMRDNSELEVSKSYSKKFKNYIGF
jgi:DNA-binding LytR/AlgR family response regulator